MRRADKRTIRVNLFDGRGTANVWIEDGYGRPVSKIFYVVGVHSEVEAIAAAREDGLKEDV